MDGLDEAMIGDRIRRTRLNRNMSQEDLAARSGVNKATVARVETRGTAQPGTVRKLAAALVDKENAESQPG
jgi:transcriptional regulator with XRE-family HTH domain